MEVVTQHDQHPAKRQPWGMLPPRMRVLFVTNASHTGSWLAEAFAADSATQVILEETVGVVHGLARLRDELFDVVLIAHDAAELNALEILDAVHAGASPSQPVIVLGSEPAAEMEAICLESGAGAYMTWDTTTTRSLIWQIARASERHKLLEENRQLRQAKLHQRDVDEAESHRMLESSGDSPKGWRLRRPLRKPFTPRKIRPAGSHRSSCSTTTASSCKRT